MAEAEFYRNGGRHNTQPLPGDVLKILVVGEPKVGKSSFIRTFARDNLSGLTFSNTGSTVYPYSYYHLGVLRKFALVEIPGVNENGLDRAIYTHDNAKGCVLMFAIDDPSSLQQLRNKWHPALDYFVNQKRTPMIAVGFKKDQREKQHVIDRLALSNLAPVTSEEGQGLVELPQILRYFECSHDDLRSVNDACSFILTRVYDYANPQNA